MISVNKEKVKIMISEHIFRAYDVRGVFNKELTAELAARIGTAYGSFLLANKKKKILVGRDVRTTSEIMENAFISGAASAGISCISTGLVPICVANFKILKGKFDAGAYITASHNPPEYNGIRLRREDGSGYTEENGIVWTSAIKGDFKLPQWDKVGSTEHIDKEETINEYKDFLLSRIKIKKKISALLDIGNGAAYFTAPLVLKEAGVEVKTMNASPDGRFPGRGSEPNEKTLTALMSKVKEAKADFGAGYDGDCDRVIFVDEKGKAVKTEKIGIILAREFLKEGRGKRKGIVVANVSCSMIVEEEISKLGGEVKRVRVGDVFVCEAMKKYNAIFGLETSAHLFMPAFYIFDDPILATLLLARILSEEKKTLSQLANEIPSYPYEEKNFPCRDEIKFKVVEKIADSFKAQGREVDLTDGVKVNFKEGWILIRPSNTSPIVRVAAEAKTEKKLEELLKITEKEIKKAAGK